MPAQSSRVPGPKRPGLAGDACDDDAAAAAAKVWKEEGSEGVPVELKGSEWKAVPPPLIKILALALFFALVSIPPDVLLLETKDP